MSRFFKRLSVDFRTISPARVFVAISALGSSLVGFCYLFASENTLKFTDLYDGLTSFNAVKAWGAWTLFSGLMLLLGAILNKRSMIALWAFQNVLIWLFAGMLFALQLPESWFTIAAIWFFSFSGALYSRYLAMRPPPEDEDKFDEHVDLTRRASLDRANANMLD